MLSDMSGRSISSVLTDIVQNIQDIVRSELRLARIEVTEEVGKAKTAGALLGAGACCGFLAAFFALFAAVYALSMVMPQWAAALVVAVAVGIAAMVMVSAGRKRLAKVHQPERTVQTVKENIQWAKQQTR